VASNPTTISMGKNTMPVSIGGRLGLDSFNGLINEVRFYSRALNEMEIQNLYQNH
jgi:hypothetical protein